MGAACNEGKKSEGEIKSELLKWLSQRTLAWNNPTGVCRALSSSHKITYGQVGSPDILLILPIKITPEMVGETIGVFCGVEVKTAVGRQSDQQKNFEGCVKECHGLYVIARSMEDLIEGIENGIQRISKGTMAEARELSPVFISGWKKSWKLFSNR